MDVNEDVVFANFGCVDAINIYGFSRQFRRGVSAIDRVLYFVGRKGLVYRGAFNFRLDVWDYVVLIVVRGRIPLGWDMGFVGLLCLIFAGSSAGGLGCVRVI